MRGLLNKILSSLATNISDEEPLNFILELKEFTLGESAAIETYLYDDRNDKDLPQIISILEREIEHRERSMKYSLKSIQIDDSNYFKRQIDVLFAKGRRKLLSARLAGRMNQIDRAKSLYSSGKDIYQNALQLFLIQDPRLKAVLDEANKALKNREKKVWNVDGGKDGSLSVRWTAITLRFPTIPTESPYEDLFRRTAANYFVTASLATDYVALEKFQNGEIAEEIDQEIEDSTRFLYLAMEVFPDNLDFHQDLFDRWRGRGELFGCPMKTTEHYYHIQCPLAIMHHFGAWYVSPTLEYSSLVCSICGKDALECKGRIYDLGEGT